MIRIVFWGSDKGLQKKGWVGLRTAPTYIYIFQYVNLGGIRSLSRRGSQAGSREPGNIAAFHPTVPRHGGEAPGIGWALKILTTTFLELLPAAARTRIVASDLF